MEAYWADSLDALREVLETPLGEIVDGRRWEDIPFDWQGYK
jgi:hypothetical protein